MERGGGIIDENKTDCLPPEMLQSIYKLLPFADLLLCRLVNSAWKTAATDIVRKRGGPIPLREFSRLKQHKILEKLKDLVEHADGHFPVDKFIKSSNSASLFELFSSVAAFVTEFSLYLELGGRGVRGVSVIDMARSLMSVEEFSKLKLLELRVKPNEPDDEEKTDFENVDVLTLGLIKNVIAKSPKLERISLVLLGRNAEVMNTIPRCVQGLGIRALKLLTSLEFKATFADTGYWQVVSGMGLKLKDLTVWVTKSAGYQQGCLKAFLASQAETLTALVIGSAFITDDESDIELNSRTGRVISVEFPCLPKLNKLKISRRCDTQIKIRFSNLCYKSQLPELKELCIHKAPFESYKKFINNSTGAFVEKLESFTFSKMVLSQTKIKMTARLFPNIRKLGILGGGADSLLAVYKYMPQLEELCLKVRDVDDDDDDDDCVGYVITGLDKREYRDIPSTSSWDQTIEKLELRLMITSIAALKNLKILRIHRDNEDWTRSPDLNDLSVHVLKKLKNLQVIDFGVSQHGPHINVPLMSIEELREHCALIWKRPSHHRLKEFEYDIEIDSPQVSSNSDTSDSD